MLMDKTAGQWCTYFWKRLFEFREVRIAISKEICPFLCGTFHPYCDPQAELIISDISWIELGSFKGVAGEMLAPLIFTTYSCVQKRNGYVYRASLQFYPSELARTLTQRCHEYIRGWSFHHCFRSLRRYPSNSWTNWCCWNLENRCGVRSINRHGSW